MGKVKSLFCSVVYYTVYNTEDKLLVFKYIYLQKNIYQSQRIYSFFCKMFWWSGMEDAGEGVINIFTNTTKILYQFPSFLPLFIWFTV